jgi:hypothetical protein
MKLQDFQFKFAGYGHYQVSYTSPKTGKKWNKTISDMTLIDATKNADNPKVKDLNKLKSIIKN